jgi:hypothetical protein
MRNNLLGGAASFASFLGIGKGTARRNTASRPRADDDDSDMRRSRSADQDETFKDDENGDPGNPDSVPDDGGDDAEGDPEEEPARGARRKKAKKAKRRASDQTDDDDANPSDDGADGPDDDDDNDDDPNGDQSDDQDDDDADDDDADAEMRGRGPAAAARRREQARCAAIFGCKAAGRNIEYAAHLAFNTRLGRREAIGLLKAAPAASSGGGLSRAMDRYAGARPGPDRVPASNSAKAIADSWDKVLTSTQGKR